MQGTGDAKRALHDVMYAPTKTDAETAIGAFVAEFEVKYPKATGLPGGGPGAVADVLLLSSRARDAPADDEPDRVAVRDGQAPAASDEGCGLPDEGPAVAFKLLEMAQRRWRRLNGAHLLPLVRAGVHFVDGAMQERDPTEMEARKEAA